MSSFVDSALLVRDNSDVVSFFVGSAVKATVLLSFVAVLCLALRRRHAATRHLLWTLALCGSLALPLLSSTLGVWQVRILPETATLTQFVSESNLTNEADWQQRPSETRRENNHTFPFEVNEDSQPSITYAYGLAQPSGDASTAPQVSAVSRLPHWTTLVLAVWLVGATLFLIRLLAGIIGTGLLTRRAAEFGKGEWTELFSTLLIQLNLTGKVRLLRSERTLMPMVCGVLRPTVLLPANADEWTEERRRVVLLHELAHVARRDCLTQVLTQMTCAFYWFNPLVWHAARQSRIERERACDDYVLSVGAKPSAYAHHLLEIARSLQSRRMFELSVVASVAMARQSQLENRLLAILERDVKSQTTPRVITACVIALLSLAMLTIAAVRPTTRAAQNIPSPPADARVQTIRNSSSVKASAANSPSQGETAIQEADGQASEQERKRKDEDDGEDDSTVTQTIEADIEPDITQDIETDIEQDIERDTAGDTANSNQTVKVPMPRVNPQINIRVNPDFDFDFNYEQEREQEAAAKRGEQSSDYIEELASVGYKNLSVEQLVQLKTHGVTAAYIKSLRALGFNNLSLNQIAALRIHGVTPAYLEAMRAAGFAELTPSQLATFRFLGITPEYIKTMRGAGFPNLSANQLLAFRMHDVTPEFIAGMRAAGYPDVSPNQLTQARIMGVTPQFVRLARSRLGELSINQIIALKQTGIIKESSDK